MATDPLQNLTNLFAMSDALDARVSHLEERLDAQEEISREQEKDIVTLKLQVAGLFDRITGTVVKKDQASALLLQPSEDKAAYDKLEPLSPGWMWVSYRIPLRYGSKFDGWQARKVDANGGPLLQPGEKAIGGTFTTVYGPDLEMD